MEYSVGSLADLISGQNTPNKPKLISKTFKTVSPKVTKTTASGNPEKPPKKPKKKPKETIRKPPQKGEGRKRTIETTEDNSPAKKPKLGKNELNAANRIKNKFNQEIKTSTDYNENTLFVGNIPLQVAKEEVRKHFRKYGEIQSIRIRGIPVADIKTPKRIAAIKKEYHPDRKSVYAFIKFKNGEDARKAQAENGQLFFNHHLRVHYCEEEKNYDQSKAIFVGNLPFQAEEEELWNIFKSCGPIAHIRVVRDGRTGMGKGFAYVNFQDSDSVQLALEMGKFTLKDRELRVSFCETNRAKKKTMGKNPGQNVGIKKEKVGFAGTKFTDKKKKKKSSKTKAKKKILAQKLVAPKKVD